MCSDLMRKYEAIALLVVGMVGTLYFAWAFHRASDAVLVSDLSWPRPAPYPDGWILALNHWFDLRHPAPPDSLKLHGEFPRVRLAIGIALAGFVFWLAAGLRIGATLGRRDLAILALRRPRRDEPGGGAADPPGH
jgi:hypothetical protein